MITSYYNVFAVIVLGCFFLLIINDPNLFHRRSFFLWVSIPVLVLVVLGSWLVDDYRSVNAPHHIVRHIGSLVLQDYWTTDRYEVVSQSVTGIVYGTNLPAEILVTNCLW